MPWKSLHISRLRGGSNIVQGLELLYFWNFIYIYFTILWNCFCLFIVVLNLALVFNNRAVLWDHAERYFINLSYYSTIALPQDSPHFQQSPHLFWGVITFSFYSLTLPFPQSSFSLRKAKLTALSKAWLHQVGLFCIVTCLMSPPRKPELSGVTSACILDSRK